MTRTADGLDAIRGSLFVADKTARRGWAWQVAHSFSSHAQTMRLARVDQPRAQRDASLTASSNRPIRRHEEGYTRKPDNFGSLSSQSDRDLTQWHVEGHGRGRERIKNGPAGLEAEAAAHGQNERPSPSGPPYRT